MSELKIAAVIAGSGIDPCCCVAPCNVIPRSLCGTAGSLRCAWYPEFTDPSADPPIVASCPPRFYRTRTLRETSTLSTSGPTFSVTVVYDVTLIYEISIDSEGVCQTTCTSSGTVRKTESYYEGSGYTPHTKVEDLIAVGCLTYDGTVSVSYPEYPEDDYSYDVTNYGGVGESPNIYGFANFFTIFDRNGGFDVTITNTSWIATSDDPRFGMDSTRTATAILSDEVTLADELEFKRCNEEACSEDDDPAPENPCRPCCTVRGATEPDSYTYITDEPEGCIIPGSSSVAWDSSPCDTSGTRSGQGVHLSVWFKDLLPGAVYKATIVYLRCPFGEDEEDEPIYPSGCLVGPVDEESCDEVTDEVTFTATNWGEMLSWDCASCEVLLKMCELEDEANDWNTANPEEPPRSVACTSGGFDIPASHETYTWFQACELELITPPPEP